jgi:hypothetical protein
MAFGGLVQSFPRLDVLADPSEAKSYTVTQAKIAICNRWPTLGRGSSRREDEVGASFFAVRQGQSNNPTIQTAIKQERDHERTTAI